MPKNEKKMSNKTAATALQSDRNRNFPPNEDPDPSLMRKLGIFLSDQRQIKTTTHPHPLLSGDLILDEQRRKQGGLSSFPTTPTSGTVYSDFLGESSPTPQLRKVPLHPRKTSSLDFRKRTLERSMSSSTRRSFEDVRTSGESSQETNQKKSPDAHLWNNDPRRNSLVESSGTNPNSLSILLSRKLSLKRQNLNKEIQFKDAAVKKLPQLFRLSPSPSSRSSAASSIRSLPTSEEENEKRRELQYPINVISPDSSIIDKTLCEGDTTLNCDVIINSPTPPTPGTIPPPLPPKTSQLRETSSHPISSLQSNQDEDSMDRLRPPLSRYGHHRAMSDHIIEQRDFLNIQLKDSSVKNWNQNQNHFSEVNSSFLKSSENSITARLLKEKMHQTNNNPNDGFMNSGEINRNRFERRSMQRSSTRSIPVGFDRQRPQIAIFNPLHFELCYAIKTETIFAGRHWLFAEILSNLNNSNSASLKGVLIHGRSGHGKTSIMSHLASSSYQGWGFPKPVKFEEAESVHRRGSNLSRNSSPMIRRRAGADGGSHPTSRPASPASSLNSAASSRAGSMVSLVDDISRRLASQSNDKKTCLLPEFLHNLISRMCLAPQLAAYKELLLHDPRLQNLASYQNCILNPVEVFRELIIQPLWTLRRNQQISKLNFLILIDSITEAEEHSPDHGYSILSFLLDHLLELPEFLKVVLTCHSDDKSIFEKLPLCSISLDNLSTVDNDMLIYTSHRIAASEFLSTFTLTGNSEPLSAQQLLTQHLVKKAQGNFLYLRMCLDFIETNAIVLKSSGFKVIPINLHEVCLLLCNLNFRNYTSFNDVRDILAVAFASYRPLCDEDLFRAVSHASQELSWDIFNQNMSLLEKILILNGNTGKRSLFHPFLKKWFTSDVKHGQIQSSNRFHVEIKRGHALLATMLSRQPISLLNAFQVLELAQHLNDSIVGDESDARGGLPIEERHVRLLTQHRPTLTGVLALPQTTLFPNMKVLNLLLISGANPNVKIQILENASPLAVAARAGYRDVVELLLAYGADVNFLSNQGMSPLSFASASGHLNVVLMLLQYQPSSFPDRNGRTPLIHAIANGHSNVAKLLLSPDLYPNSHSHMVAVQQALVASAAGKSSELIEYLLEEQDFEFDVNFLDPASGESPLTSAAMSGQTKICELLIRMYRASPYFPNREGFTPFLCAIKSGEWDAVDLLLNLGASLEAGDLKGRSPLIFAACLGQTGTVQLLLTRGANPAANDIDGLTALCWAAAKGHVQCVELLISLSDLDHCDVLGRTAVDHGVNSGVAEIVCLLAEAGSDLRHSDLTGMTVLDRAISLNDSVAVSNLLRYGAEIKATSWVLASGKTELIAVLLKSSLDDGNFLYKKMLFSKASDAYLKALKHAGELSPFSSDVTHDRRISEVCANLLLSYSRCMRKLKRLEEAEKSVSRALDLRPGFCDALYVRSRVAREQGKLEAALVDVIDAERYATPRSLREIRRLKQKILEESERQEEKSDPPSSTEIEIPIDSYHGAPPHHRRENFILDDLNSSHPANLSQSYDPNCFVPPQSERNFYPASSQESLAESHSSLSMSLREPYPGNFDSSKPPSFHQHTRSADFYYPSSRNRTAHVTSNRPITKRNSFRLATTSGKIYDNSVTDL